MKPKNVQDSDFMSKLYIKAPKVYEKPKFTIGDRVRISKYDLPFRKVINQKLHKKFLKLLPILLKNLQDRLSKTKKKKLFKKNFTRRKRLESLEYGFA